MASTYLTSNIGSPSQQRFTWSLWVKRSKLGVEQHMVGNYNANNRTHLFFTNTEKLYFYSELSGSNVIAYQTNRLFRDLNAWYHIVCAVDTTQAGGNRIRIYVNGEEETSFATETECNQNTNLSIGTTHYIGTYGGDAGSASYSFDGSMSHLHFVDGSQLTPSSFGSTDSTTGEWKINTAPSVTYGSSGYFILKDGNSVTDQSGNSNNFTVANGTLTKTEDNPSNVFATLNPLATSTTSGSFSNGNTTHAKSNSTWASTTSTLAASSGKYYAEYKFTVNSSSSNGQMAAIVNMDLTNYMNENSDLEQNGNKGITYYANGTVFADNQQTVATYGSYTNNIIQIAMDLDNGFLYFGKDGVWQNSANPASGATGTGGINISNYLGTGTFAFGLANRNTGSTSVNFGNGYFGTTAVSSAGTNASGNGIFEYDVPTGYTALSTKGLDS